MYPAPFEYLKAGSVKEAAELLGKHPDSRLLAGGHSLLPAMKMRLATPTALIDIGGLTDLAGIRVEKKALRIGALTTHAAIADSPDVGKHCPVLAETAAQIGDLQVRNRGTIGGSLAHADPAADFPTTLLALGATLTATGAKKGREIAAADFFVSLFTTALKEGELLTGIAVPGYGSGTGAAYVKHRHPASSYAVVGVAAVVTLEKGRCTKAAIAVGGASATPRPARPADSAQFEGGESRRIKDLEQAHIAHRLDEESGVKQVHDGVLGTAGVGVHRQPVRGLFGIERAFAVLR